jgi:hypothetical protein
MLVHSIGAFDQRFEVLCKGIRKSSGRKAMSGAMLDPVFGVFWVHCRMCHDAYKIGCCCFRLAKALAFPANAEHCRGYRNGRGAAYTQVCVTESGKVPRQQRGVYLS